MKQTIFAVEDDAALQDLYVYSLENEYNCRCFDCGETFFAALSETLPDLVLLDIMLPSEDGFTILLHIKNDKATAHIPVIMVSAKGEELSKVKGLNMGADDYIAKPFGVLEFVARVKANLRKNPRAVGDGLTYKDIVIDVPKRRVTVNDRYVPTTLKEYTLLRLLCTNAEQVQERKAIFHAVWGDGFTGETRTLDIHIKDLRKKLLEAESQTSIQTIRGVGYMLI